MKIPDFTVYRSNNKSYAKVSQDGVVHDVLIETGVSDGEFIEVRSGLTEGQTVVVIAE